MMIAYSPIASQEGFQTRRRSEHANAKRLQINTLSAFPLAAIRGCWAQTKGEVFSDRVNDSESGGQGG